MWVGAGGALSLYSAPQEVFIVSEPDVVVARRLTRAEAEAAGFELTDVTRVVTAASELARNVLAHGGGGRLLCRVLAGAGGRRGIELTFEDQGPGIPDVEAALTKGFSTGNGLGLGLPGARRLMDELEVRSSVGEGTTVVVRKWLPA